jgi:hypothetical protein
MTPKLSVFCTLVAIATALARAESYTDCSCAPRQITFELDFTKSCHGNLIKSSRGSPSSVSDTFCSIVSSKGINHDLTPVKTTSVQLFELDESLNTVKKEEHVTSSLFQGEIIHFQSSVSEARSSKRMPGGFQMRVIGENKNGKSITMDWIVQYDSICSVEPFTVGDQMGWAKVVSRKS